MTRRNEEASSGQTKEWEDEVSARNLDIDCRYGSGWM